MCVVDFALIKTSPMQTLHADTNTCTYLHIHINTHTHITNARNMLSKSFHKLTYNDITLSPQKRLSKLLYSTHSKYSVLELV